MFVIFLVTFRDLDMMGVIEECIFRYFSKVDVTQIAILHNIHYFTLEIGNGQHTFLLQVYIYMKKGIK